MRPSVIDVCEDWMGATDLFTYNPQSVLLQCLNKQDGELLKPYRVLDLVPLSQGQHKKPCCNPVVIDKMELTANPVQGSMALILPLPTGREVAMSATASNGLKNMWADELSLSVVSNAVLSSGVQGA